MDATTAKRFRDETVFCSLVYNITHEFNSLRSGTHRQSCPSDII